MMKSQRLLEAFAFLATIAVSALVYPCYGDKCFADAGDGAGAITASLGSFIACAAIYAVYHYVHAHKKEGVGNPGPSEKLNAISKIPDIEVPYRDAYVSPHHTVEKQRDKETDKRSGGLFSGGEDHRQNQ